MSSILLLLALAILVITPPAKAGGFLEAKATNTAIRFNSGFSDNACGNPLR
jgi:hypothetical protein